MQSPSLRAFRFALKLNTPIMIEYFFLGIASGILLNQAGYAPIWSLLAALFIYAGAMQIIMVPLMSGGASLLTIAAMTFLINARHMFYGIGFVERFRAMGRPRSIYMALSVTDETFTALSTVQYPENIDPQLGDFFINLTAHMTWVISCFLGGLAGEILSLSIAGIDFCSTAFFITAVVNQWQQFPSHIPAITGAVSAVAFYLLLGPDGFILPALGASMVALMLLRDRVWLKMKEEQERA